VEREMEDSIFGFPGLAVGGARKSRSRSLGVRLGSGRISMLLLTVTLTDRAVRCGER